MYLQIACIPIGRPLKKLLEVWDRNGSTSGPTPFYLDDDTDEDDDDFSLHSDKTKVCNT